MAEPQVVQIVVSGEILYTPAPEAEESNDKLKEIAVRANWKATELRLENAKLRSKIEFMNGGLAGIVTDTEQKIDEVKAAIERLYKADIYEFGYKGNGICPELFMAICDAVNLVRNTELEYPMKQETAIRALADIHSSLEDEPQDESQALRQKIAELEAEAGKKVSALRAESQQKTEHLHQATKRLRILEDELHRFSQLYEDQKLETAKAKASQDDHNPSGSAILVTALESSVEVYKDLNKTLNDENLKLRTDNGALISEKRQILGHLNYWKDKAESTSTTEAING